MDTADKFINNRAPKRILLYFAAVLILSVISGFFIADSFAEKNCQNEIKMLLSAAGGEISINGVYSEEAIHKGEMLYIENGLSSETSPRLMSDFKKQRREIWLWISLLSLILCSTGAFFSCYNIFRIYDDLESLRDEALRIAEKGGSTEKKYGGGLSCIRRVAEGIDRISETMEHQSSVLASDKDFLRNFLTDFSHQLKTSLAVIRLNNDLLDSMDSLTEEKAEMLSEEINICIDDMESLIFSALKLARLNAGSVEYIKNKGDLSVLCSHAVSKVRSIADKKNIFITENTDIHAEFEFDDVWLSEAVTNLIKNSADHSQCTEITISLTETPVSVVISISDNGKGIPQSAIPGIFDRFGKTSNSSGMDSVGVGMSIAEKIVRAHNGEILIYSGEGKGTRFDIVLLK